MFIGWCVQIPALTSHSVHQPPLETPRRKILPQRITTTTWLSTVTVGDAFVFYTLYHVTVEFSNLIGRSDVLSIVSIVTSDSQGPEGRTRHNNDQLNKNTYHICRRKSPVSVGFPPCSSLQDGRVFTSWFQCNMTRCFLFVFLTTIKNSKWYPTHLTDVPKLEP